MAAGNKRLMLDTNAVSAFLNRRSPRLCHGGRAAAGGLLIPTSTGGFITSDISELNEQQQQKFSRRTFYPGFPGLSGLNLSLQGASSEFAQFAPQLERVARMLLVEQQQRARHQQQPQYRQPWPGVEGLAHGSGRLAPQCGDLPVR